MTKADLIDEVSRLAELTRKDSEVIVETIFDSIVRSLRVGDKIEIGRPFGRKQTIRVRELAERHIAKADARLLYEDLTPPPTPEEIEARRLERMYRAAVTPPRAPDKRERRALRKLRGRDD